MGTVLAGMALDFTADTPIDQAVGYVFLDIDQNPDTGLPADAVSGLPTQDVGMEYFIDLFAIHDPEPVIFIVERRNLRGRRRCPATVDGQSLIFDIPLEAIGGDDGNINTAMVAGRLRLPVRLGPGRGPRHDRAVLRPARGSSRIRSPATVAPGDSQVAQVTLGGAGLAPGNYQALIVLVTNDPKRRNCPSRST